MADKSRAYRDGYEAYMHWSWAGTSNERPVNPYPVDTAQHADWQDGWDDASFDV